MPVYTCHCCGGVAVEDHQDPHRDQGFGTCDRCRTWLEMREGEEWRKMREVVRQALNPANRAKWDAMPDDDQRVIVLQLMDEHLLTWTVKRPRPIEGSTSDGRA